MGTGIYSHLEAAFPQRSQSENFMIKRMTLLVAALTVLSLGLAQALAEVPSTGNLTGPGYWKWIAMAGFTAVVAASCFKNPKRSHDN